MKARLGALLFGAALVSLVAPKARRTGTGRTAAAPETARRLYALVQTRPTIAVLALSAHIEELEREVVELNETWNHWALRSERRRFEIQTAPVLAASLAPIVRSREDAAQRR